MLFSMPKPLLNASQEYNTTSKSHLFQPVFLTYFLDDTTTTRQRYFKICVGTLNIRRFRRIYKVQGKSIINVSIWWIKTTFQRRLKTSSAIWPFLTRTAPTPVGYFLSAFPCRAPPPLLCVSLKGRKRKMCTLTSHKITLPRVIRRHSKSLTSEIVALARYFPR
jgi:hypothetical protein